LQIFYSLKAHLFGWKLLVIFWQPVVKRLLGSARVQTPDAQIPSLMPCCLVDLSIFTGKNKKNMNKMHFIDRRKIKKII